MPLFLPAIRQLSTALALGASAFTFAQTLDALPVPDEANIPAGPMGEAIKRGKLILACSVAIRGLRRRVPPMA